MSTSRRLRSMSMRIRLDVFAPLWVAYALLVARFAFVTDDAFITFRYARNLIDGHGLRFNPGDPVPVEGYSNFLWVLLSAVVEALGLAPSFWIPLVSFLCGSVLLFLVFDELQRRRGVPAPLAGLASATLALSPAFALWSTSGLETVPFALLLYLTADRLIFRSSRPDGEGIDVRTTAVLALAVSLIRVEGILWVGVLIGVAALSARVSGRNRDRAPLVRIAAIVAAGYAVYFAFRTVYFQDWLPNTVHAKSGLSVALLLRGFDYVAVHFLTAVTPFLLFVATPFALARERRSLGLPVALLAWAFPVYAVASTGDFMAMGRFLVPGLPYAAILVGLWLQATPRRGSRSLAPAAAVVAVAVGAGLLPSVGVYAVPESVRARFHFRLSADRFRGEFAQWQYQRDNAAAWACKGRALRRYAAARLGPGTDPSVVQVAVGAVGYYSDLFVYDGAGLVSPAVARRALPPPSQQPPRSPGHDRVVGPRFFLPAEPTLLRADVLEDGAPGTWVAAVEESAKTLRGAWPELEPAQRYVPDFARIASPGGDCGPVTLATWRRIAPGEDWRREWADFDARLRRFRESGEIVTISAEAGASLPASEGGRPDVLLVLVDTLRFDRVGAYGADRPTTPNLDALAKSGVRFERAYSPAPWTKPAAASILTGLYPSSHGATAVASRLSEEVTTLAEILEAEGYATYGVVSGSFLGSHHGFGQGFDHYDESQIRGSTASTT
ncbi:MAG: sulfatase-like hydrolase/transferase, partial [Proteobacteria bacterium]|nr:sulfatase-like hydrolase/transferase [Pseudomonadota bacterium]